MDLLILKEICLLLIPHMLTTIFDWTDVIRRKCPNFLLNHSREPETNYTTASKTAKCEILEVMIGRALEMDDGNISKFHSLMRRI
jgi:hypothetical protein